MELVLEQETATSKTTAGLPALLPEGHNRMAQLDALRAFAALGVIASHSMSYRGHAAGAYGVTLFFVLSGFLITGILMQCRDRAAKGEQRRLWELRQFYCRRFLRIFPLYYFILIVLFAFGYEPVREGAVWFFTYMTDFYLGHPGVWKSAVAHLWSLAVEEQFYLVWPWIVLWTPRRMLPWVAVLMVVSSPIYRGVASAMGASEGALWVSPFSCLDALGIGSMLAIATQEGWSKQLRRIALPCGIIATILLVICREKAPVLGQALWSFGPSLLSMCLVGGAAVGFRGVVGNAASWKPLLWVGTISYGVYVYHLPLLMLWERYGYATPDIVTFVVVTAATILVAAISWYAFERPINNLKRFFPYVARK